MGCRVKVEDFKRIFVWAMMEYSRSEVYSMRLELTDILVPLQNGKAAMKTAGYLRQGKVKRIEYRWQKLIQKKTRLTKRAKYSELKT